MVVRHGAPELRPGGLRTSEVAGLLAGPVHKRGGAAQTILMRHAAVRAGTKKQKYEKWQGLRAGNKKQKYEKISERKITT